MSAISFYIRDFLKMISFALIPTLVVEYILVMLMFNLPLLYSFLVCIIGNVATAAIEGAIISVGTDLGFTSEELIQKSLLHLIVFQLLSTTILLIAVFFLQKSKIGFHITTTDALKGYNFLLSAILIISVVVMQLEMMSFEVSALHLVIPCVLLIIFLIGIYLSYKHNVKLWKDRRERLSKKSELH
jgi:hypothetical protein